MWMMTKLLTLDVVGSSRFTQYVLSIKELIHARTREIKNFHIEEKDHLHLVWKPAKVSHHQPTRGVAWT
jgi:hypothetical protein